ncbi:MAG: hypothetical protein LBF93_12770 [Zoogloeaceae bacterium]|jgi:hypothetical protein|nr:hypothetical protein [Zoogloeaceae bacterium]
MNHEPFLSAFDVFANGEGAAKRAVRQDPAKTRALKEALFSLKNEIRRKIDCGLPTNEIAAAKSLLAAAQIAEDVVEGLSA